MPYSVGTKTVNKSFLTSESYKLHIAFIAAAAVEAGQAVKLDATGKIIPCVTLEDKSVVIGYSMFKTAIGDTATIIMKSASVIMAQATEVTNPTDLISYDGFDGATGYNKVIVTGATVANQIGYALEPAAAIGDIIEVALF